MIYLKLVFKLSSALSGGYRRVAMVSVEAPYERAHHFLDTMNLAKGERLG